MKKKILMVHNFYQIGGGEHTVFRNEVELLRSYGHEVVEYTRSNDELKKSRLKLLMSPLSTLWSWKTYREIRRVIRTQGIDIVHCHNTFPLISPSVYSAALSMKIPVVQTIHNFRLVCPCGILFAEGHVCEKCLEKGMTEALKGKCYRSSFVQTLIVTAMLKLHRMLGTYRKIDYVFLTEFNRNVISKKLGLNENRTYVKPNFSSAVNQERSIQKCCENKYFFVGRLDEYKGIRFLVDVWAESDFGSLYIYGDGKLAEYVESLSDGKKIIYRGFCKKEEIYRECGDAQAMIFPSELYEGFPMTIVESLSCGIPVISTNIGNHGSIIRDGVNGFRFEVGSKESLAQAIENVRLMGGTLRQSAYDEYLNRYTSETNYNQLIEIYERIGTNHGR